MSTYHISTAAQNSALYHSALERFQAFIPPQGGWIAGGALRAHFAREPIKDIDVFFAKQRQLDAELQRLLNFGYTVVYDNPKVLRLNKAHTNVDLVKTKFKDPLNTIAQFDFTVAAIALDADKLVYHEDFFVDLAARRLVLNDVPFPVATLVRIQRYINKGYRCCPEELRKLAGIINSAERKSLAAEDLYHSVD